MSSRSVLGRPRRTKVYDCNFNIGERYYKPVVDSLDRKHTPGISSSIRTPSPERNAISHMRATLLANDDELSSRRMRRAAADLDLESDEPLLPRRQQRKLLDEYDSIYEDRNKSLGGGESTPSRSLKAIEDDVDQQIADSMKRIKMRVAESSLEDDFVSGVALKGSRRRDMVDFQDKLLDTVGLKSSEKSRISALDNESSSSSSVYKRRALQMSEEDESSPRELTKWTAFKMDGEADDFGAAEAAAAARARKTRARLADLDAEMEELTARSVARDKRVKQLRDLIKENESTTADLASSSSSLKSSMVQKSSLRSEKKTVTF